MTSPKTEHHDGGGSRVIPLFPELRPYLQAVQDERETDLESDDVAVPMSEPVVTRYRRMDSNYGVLLGKLVRRAGITMWAKPFQNLRSSRETELAEQFPMHVVCEWIGNSVPVAQKHYLQVTTDHFARATGPVSCSPALHDLATGAERGDNSDPPPNLDPTKTSRIAEVSAGKRQQPTGLSGRYRTRNSTEYPRETAPANPSAARTAAVELLIGLSESEYCAAVCESAILRARRKVEAAE